MLSVQDLGRAKAFYVEKVGLQALESDFLKARDGAGGPRGWRWCQPALRLSRPGQVVREFTQAVIHVTDVRAAVEEMRGRGVEFEEYDTAETRTEKGVVRMPGGGEAAWSKDSEGKLAALFRPEENQPRGILARLRRRRKLWSHLLVPPRRTRSPLRLLLPGRTGQHHAHLSTSAAPASATPAGLLPPGRGGPLTRDVTGRLGRGLLTGHTS